MKEVSEWFRNTFAPNAEAKTDEEYIHIANGTRFSVLSPQILRVETGAFCDAPTQKVLCRRFSSPKHSFEVKEEKAVIATSECVFVFDLKRGHMSSVTLKSGQRITDFHTGNLKGTARTLDMVNGACRLGDGLISKNGAAILDDSESCVLNEDGTIAERNKCSDVYYFAFGRDYRECLRQFTLLCGSIPLIPRYCLGNWWSRYKAYTQQEYLNLMEKFFDNEIPITVATIDMDWHWVDVIKRFGKEAAFKRKNAPWHNPLELFQSQGWTGYSWNTELFPDYKALLKKLHSDGHKVTVNLHPAQGVRFFEDAYKAFAEFMGIDPQSREQIYFDIADPKFVEGYFRFLHEPYENDGVDFWWIDWQQEKTTAVKGLDPLWALNHYHTLAASRDGKRPLILSRFAGIGSHRYPLGFSGDTIISWESLDFQPYFTITAANAAYSWWSHDIGGHQLGSRDDELYARWVQFGQFSPIMRLHSTSDEFMGKEPWKYSAPARDAAVNAMRGRHAMIPYIYSMNRRTHEHGIALCEPAYYTYPDDENAYKVKNEYFFGSELLVVPITSPADKLTNLAWADVWLPEGRWTDIYTGYIYDGGQTVKMFRDISSIPVLAKEGAILPLSTDDRSNDCSNPSDMTLRIWRGKGEFKLYEDDGETTAFENGCYAVTRFRIDETGKDILFTASKAEGEVSVLPSKRILRLCFDDVKDFDFCEISKNGKVIEGEIKKFNSRVFVVIPDFSPEDEIVVKLSGTTPRSNESKKEMMINRLSGLQMSTIRKRLEFSDYIKDISKPLKTKNKAVAGMAEEIMAMK